MAPLSESTLHTSPTGWIGPGLDAAHKSERGKGVYVYLGLHDDGNVQMVGPDG